MLVVSGTADLPLVAIGVNGAEGADVRSTDAESECLAGDGGGRIGSSASKRCAPRSTWVSAEQLAETMLDS
jgi:hypothetical protein